MLKNRAVNIVFLLVLAGMAIADLFRVMPWWTYGGCALLYVLVQVYGAMNLSAGFFVDVRDQGEASGNAVAVTFDDGPVPGKTDRLLDLLKAHEVKAAFFCIGHRVTEHPALARRIVEEGHIIGNHSFRHGSTFDLQPGGRIEADLRLASEAIRSATGHHPRFFRPPYGVTNPMVAYAVKKGRFTTVGWTLRSFDTVIKDAARLKRRVTRLLKPGNIILFHDQSDAMFEVLPSFLEHISKLGLKIVRVDELLNEKPYA